MLQCQLSGARSAQRLDKSSQWSLFHCLPFCVLILTDRFCATGSGTSGDTPASNNKEPAFFFFFFCDKIRTPKSWQEEIDVLSPVLSSGSGSFGEGHIRIAVSLTCPSNVRSSQLFYN